jgi:hypothetical protein
MPDFSRIISIAYMRILGRPADPGGLESYNRAMNDGLSEAQMRESLLRSSEYADKNPSRATTTRTASRAKKKPVRKTAKKKAAKKRAPARNRKTKGARA